MGPSWPRAFLDGSPEAFVLLDAGLRYAYLNASAEALLGYALREVRGRPLRMLDEGPEADARRRVYLEVLADGRPRTLEALKPEGPRGRRVFRVRVFKVEDGLGFVWEDVTEPERLKASLISAQDELRALTAHLVDVRELERKGLARELHDELGQSLTAIEMELRHGAKAHGDSGGPRERIDALLGLTRQALSSVQRICSELRPAILDRLGLRSAMEWLAEDCAARHAMKVGTSFDFDESSVGPKASTALFRICQEGLLNAARHSRAASVSVALRSMGGSIRLVVADDGVGISEARANAHDSFGIQGVKERARAFGGEASIAGEPGGGTSLAVSLPYPPDGRLP